MMNLSIFLWTGFEKKWFVEAEKSVKSLKHRFENYFKSAKSAERYRNGIFT